MSPVQSIKTNEELKTWLGKEVAVGRWREITQEVIDGYAKACDDYNWIHVDVERCKRESPYKTTIAHGNMIYGLLCAIRRNSDIELPPLNAGLTYGCNKIRYSGVVPCGTRVRGRYKLLEIRPMAKPGTQLVIWEVKGELEGQEKPVLVVEWIQWQELG